MSKRLGSSPFSKQENDTFSKMVDEIDEHQQKKQTNVIDGKKIRSVDISHIRPDPQQPRKNIEADNQEIKELAQSIKNHGFINFITVRENSDKDYIIVAGERRFTAAKIAGLQKVPVMVLVSEKKAVDYALIQLEENLQREDLSPFDEAKAYDRLKTDFGLQQKEIGEWIGKPKSYISQMLSINKIPDEIKQYMKGSKMVVAKKLLWDLATFPQEKQLLLWEKIRSDPTISTLEKTAKKFEKEIGGDKIKEGELDPEEVWQAFKWAVQKDKRVILSYLTPKKIEKLMNDFSCQKKEF